MSFSRLTFYCAMIGGWAAFFGWLFGEALWMHRAAVPAEWMIIATASLCGMFIGGGLNFLAGIAMGQGWWAVPRLVVGMVVGLGGGALGSWFGNLLYGFLPRSLGLVLGWMIMGMCIGCVEGIYDLRWRKIRNGLLGGTLGGLLGGFLFGPLAGLIGSPMSARAVGLVILGMCIGFLIGLAQIVLREAWLTVDEGFRPGRQLLLGNPKVYLGTSEKAQLCFIAYGAKGVAPLHVCVARQRDGSYAVNDNGSQTGTFVNEKLTSDCVRLRSGDVIRFGINKVRFNERQRTAESPRQSDSVPRGAPAAPVPPARPNAEKVDDVPVARLAPARPVVVAKQVLASGQAPLRPPAKTPASRPAPAKHSPDECPVCGNSNKPSQGKRRCDNCGMVY